MNFAKIFWMVFNLAALSATAAPKNILLIIADDYGADSSSLYNSTNNGASLPPTPNIVALAQSGVLFRNAYANPVCSPTRACLMTGRHSFRTGVGDVITGATSPLLTASEFTLPEAFAANPSLNYSLAQFGKWHLATALNSPSTIGGWPHFAGSLQGAITSFTNWTKTVNGVSAATTNYATTDLVNDATTWIQARGTNPWFAWVAFNAPHTPLHKPPGNLCPNYASLSGTQADINANPRKYFEAMTEAMDTEIGRLLASVELTNTHVIFMGDNGTMGNVIQPPYPANRGKDTLYEGGTHVPFVIRSPSVANPGRSDTTPVNAVDLYSTILELAGINVAATVPAGTKIDSQSLLPILQGATNQSRYAYSEIFNASTPAASDGQMLRNTQFKLIKFIGGAEEFYNLSNDPYEKTNLLSGALTSAQQSNYYSLTLHLGAYQTNIAQPTISSFVKTESQFTASVVRQTNLTYSLWASATCDELGWAPLTNAVVVTNASLVSLTDTNTTADQKFYTVVAK